MFRASPCGEGHILIVLMMTLGGDCGAVRWKEDTEDVGRKKEVIPARALSLLGQR